MSRENFIQMTVGGLTLDPVTKTPIVILKDPDNKLNLPIWIGLLEATAMATELEGIKMARPMTHDLLRNVIADLEGTVERIVVCDLRENTFYANIHIRAQQRALTIDARPSDAIALALRAQAKIFVEESVITGAQNVEASKDSMDVGRLRKWLEGLSDEQLGKYKM